jgi:hypothetical protein
MKELDLQILEDGKSTGLSVRYGGFLAEGASVCLENFRHPKKVQFPVKGSLAEDYYLTRIKTNELSHSSFGDLDEAVEFGAMGIAIAIINEKKGWKVKRSWKGTGFDFWAGDDSKSSRFKKKLRVEVSGDFEGTDSDLNSRLKQKLDQTELSSGSRSPACAVIVEFSNPKSITGQR